MPKFDVDKAITIQAPAEKIYSIISDFKQWRPWSPWLIMEPEAMVDVAPDGQSYSWKGSVVGEGSMTKTSEKAPNAMDCDLQFLKPWKSEAKVRFELAQDGNNTRVAWIMNSSLPFFMFFMKNMMVAMIGMDYDRGLAMLKDYAETGAVPSKLEFTGRTAFEGSLYVGITTGCEISQIGPKMEADMARLSAWAKESDVEMAGAPLCIYRKWDMSNATTQYTVGLPVKAFPPGIPEAFVTGEVPRTDTYCITHIGPYRHLGNAWSTGMALGRSKVFKQNKGIDPFEIYVNDPCEVDENDIQTKVYFPTQ